MKKVVCCGLIVALGIAWTGCKKQVGERPAANPFLGVWKIHYELTMEEGKKSPKYRADQAAVLGPMIQKAAEQMKLEVTPEGLVYTIGDRVQPLPCTTVSNDGKTLVLSSQAGGKDVQVTLTLIDGKYMNLKSTGTDDMDYYIWQRAE